MGKHSKAKKRALPKAHGALRKILEITSKYYNDTKFVNLTKIAERGLGDKLGR